MPMGGSAGPVRAQDCAAKEARLLLMSV